MPKTNTGERTPSSINSAGKTDYPYAESVTRPCLSPHTKINSKYNDLKCKTQNIMTFTRKKQGNISGHWSGQRFY